MEHEEGCQAGPFTMDCDVSEKYNFTVPGHREFRFFCNGSQAATLTERLELESAGC